MPPSATVSSENGSADSYLLSYDIRSKPPASSATGVRRSIEAHHVDDAGFVGAQFRHYRRDDAVFSHSSHDV